MGGDDAGVQLNRRMYEDTGSGTEARYNDDRLFSFLLRSYSQRSRCVSSGRS
jgi:hypothetical protein